MHARRVHLVAAVCTLLLSGCGLFDRGDPALAGPGTGATGDDFDSGPGEEERRAATPDGDLDIDLGSPVEEPS